MDGMYPVCVKCSLRWESVVGAHAAGLDRQTLRQTPHPAPAVCYSRQQGAPYL